MPIIKTGHSIKSSSFILDQIPNSVFAYSIEKVKNSYDGPCVRAWKAGGTEQEIGFSGVTLDLTSAQTFWGASSGKISRFYDQSGNNRHLIQNTSASQPLVQYNSTFAKPVVNINYTEMTYDVGDLSAILTNNFHFFSVFIVNAYNAGNDYYSQLTDPVLGATTANGISNYYSNYYGDRRDRFLPMASATYTDNFAEVASVHNIGSRILITHSRNGSDNYIKKNGVLVGSKAGTAGPLVTGTQTKYYFGNTAAFAQPNQYSICQFWFNRYLDSKEEKLMENYLIGRYLT